MKKLFIKVILIIILFISLLIIPDNVLAESFDGEYSIDYLLKNYSLVTLGQNSSLLNHYYDFSAEDIGDIRFTTNSSVSHYTAHDNSVQKKESWRHNDRSSFPQAVSPQHLSGHNCSSQEL